MNVRPIPAAELDSMWPWAEKWLARACSHSGGAETIDGLKAKCAAPGHILAIIEEDGNPVGACVFQRDSDWLHVVSLGGRRIIANMPELVDWWARIAGAVGAIGLSLQGRKGWDRVFARFGFRRNGEYLEARL